MHITAIFLCGFFRFLIRKWQPGFEYDLKKKHEESRRDEYEIGVVQAIGIQPFSS